MHAGYRVAIAFAAATLGSCGASDTDGGADTQAVVSSDPSGPPDVEVAADEAEAAMGQRSDGARSVSCEIRSDYDDGYRGPCLFTPDEGGSFALSMPDEQPIVPNVVQISVWLTGEGIAEVRGLTVDGINSRWGEATRSSEDPACWLGSDFAVCAR